jgi:hypothetical protein
MTAKLKKDNGLHDWKTELQAVTGGIFYCRDSESFSGSAPDKRLCNLKDLCFEIGNKNIPPNRYGSCILHPRQILLQLAPGHPPSPPAGGFGGQSARLYAIKILHRDIPIAIGTALHIAGPLYLSHPAT